MDAPTDASPDSGRESTTVSGSDGITTVGATLVPTAEPFPNPMPIDGVIPEPAARTPGATDVPVESDAPPFS